VSTGVQPVVRRREARVTVTRALHRCVCGLDASDRDARQQKTQADLSDFCGCFVHPGYLGAPVHDQRLASRELANNNPPIAARSFGTACTMLETRDARRERSKLLIFTFPYDSSNRYALSGDSSWKPGARILSLRSMCTEL
jgi:hypothetical protein